MKYLLIIFILTAIAFPVAIHAQTVAPAAAPAASGKFVLLTNIPALQNLANSNINSFAALTNNLYKICIGIAATLAVLQIMFAGFMYMSAGDNTERVSQARSKISAAILGLALVLSPVIVFSIINPRILDLSVLNHDISNITPAPTTSTTGTPAAAGNSCSRYTNPTAGASCSAGQQSISTSCCAGIAAGNVCCAGTTTGSATAGSESQVRDELTAAGVGINNSACVGTQTSGCTDVGGFQQQTIQEIINIKNICGAALITGGSEGGHASGAESHGTGYKVDLSTAEDSCIESGTANYFSADGSRGGAHGGVQYKDICGNTYVRETNPTHWDITVTQACTPHS